MERRRMIVTLGLVVGLAVPGAALASDHGGGQYGNHRSAVTGAPARLGHRHGHGRHAPTIRQLEGVLTAYTPDTSITMQLMGSRAITATVALTSSTVITAGEDVTTTTLAVGEQVHVVASDAADVYTALRITIQRSDSEVGERPEATETPEADDHVGQGHGHGHGHGHGRP